MLYKILKELTKNILGLHESPLNMPATGVLCMGTNELPTAHRQLLAYHEALGPEPFIAEVQRAGQQLHWPAAAPFPASSQPWLYCEALTYPGEMCFLI